MTVLLPNTALGVRRRTEAAQDALGDAVQDPATGALDGPWPGLATELPDGRWRLGLDPLAWPVRQYDVVEDAAGQQWVVDNAQLLQNPHDRTVDWVRAEALQRARGGTEPGGEEFVGRV